MLALLSVLLASPSWAQDATADVDTFTIAPVAGHPVFDLRLGAQTSSPIEHPYVCVEGYPLARVSLEACGNGSGVIHHDDVPDLAHFRARATLLEHNEGRNHVGMVVGVGFAELQVGEDAAGFAFGEARSPDQTSGAGPELSLSGKARHWFDPRAYLVLDLNVGGALIPAAPVIMGGGDAMVPFGSATIGVGF